MMQIETLDHVNIRTSKLAEMVAWYRDVLGLREGPRPNFPFPGAWLYAGDAAVVHLIGVDENPGAGSEGKLRLEHFAFSASGMEEFTAHLAAHGVTLKRLDVPGTDITQLNIWDPDGNHLHIDFRAGREAG